jgi:hypothetical protein
MYPLKVILSRAFDFSRVVYYFESHKTLANPYSRTPAMAAGIADHIWTIEEIVKLVND